VQIPVDTAGEGGVAGTTMTDPGALLYLTIGLLVASLLLIVVHPGGEKSANSSGAYYSA
jgi:hypothetical protein